MTRGLVCDCVSTSSILFNVALSLQLAVEDLFFQASGCFQSWLYKCICCLDVYMEGIELRNLLLCSLLPLHSSLPIIKLGYLFFYYWAVGILYIFLILTLYQIYMICKYCLPFHGLPFYSVDYILRYKKSFKNWCHPFVYFCSCCLCFWYYMQDIIVKFIILKIFSLIFFLFLPKCSWNFDRNCVNSIDGFG